MSNFNIPTRVSTPTVYNKQELENMDQKKLIEYVSGLSEYLKETANQQAIIYKELDWMLNGNVDGKNIRANSITANEIKANSITANEMNVNELSAISANLGHITAGLIEAITMVSSVITGSLIQTKAVGNYPRIELSSSNNLLKAEGSATERFEILFSGAIPTLRFFDNTGNFGEVRQASGNLNLTSIGNVNLDPQFGTLLYKGSDLIGTINSKANAFSGFSGSISYTDGGGNPRSMIFNNGIFAGTT